MNFRFFAIMTICMIASLFCQVSAVAQDVTQLSIIEDASGMFNERGYLKANSFSYDGEEIVNDFNGNLMWTKRLKYAQVSQNGLNFDFKITYNGSVGHTVRAGVNATDPTNCGPKSLNLPEWILSVNGIAIQTFNFENEAISFNTYENDTITYDKDVAALINGYHSCYSRGESNGSYYGNISILMGDGSVSQFVSMAYGGNETGLIDGEYRSFSKDDKTKLFVEPSGDFTMFLENGTRVFFEHYVPEWKHDVTTGSVYADPQVFLPKKFYDVTGCAIGITYVDTVDLWCGYGRPPVATVNYGKMIDFDWVGMGTEAIYRLRLFHGLTWDEDSEDSEAWYRFELTDLLPGTSPSFLGDINRAYVSYIVDPVYRRTDFFHGPYTLIGYGFGDCWFEQIHTEGTFVATPYRLDSVRYSAGGLSAFKYYPLTDNSIDYWTLCYDPYEKYPCKKTAHFADIGRDPFFINMVTWRGTYNESRGLVTQDSLRFSWNDTDDDGNIDLVDSFYTRRYLWNSDATVGKETFLQYCYYNENGPWSTATRDRGWLLKLLSTTVSEYGSIFLPSDGDEVWRQDNYWNPRTKLLDSAVTTEDGVTSCSRKDYEFDDGSSDVTADTVSNVKKVTETNAFGVKTEAVYNDSCFDVTGALSYYNNTMVNFVRVIDSNDILLSQTQTLYYNAASTNGYPGQISEMRQYFVEDGIPGDYISESFEYFKGIEEPPCEGENGALRKKMSPNGDSTIYHYCDLVEIPEAPAGLFMVDSDSNQYVTNPVTYYEANVDGSIDTTETHIVNPLGHQWYKAVRFPDQDSLSTDDTLIDQSDCVFQSSVVAYDSYQIAVMLSAVPPEDDGDVDTLIPSASGHVFWSLEVTEIQYETYAWIQINGIRFYASDEQLVNSGVATVSPNDTIIVKAWVDPNDFEGTARAEAAFYTDCPDLEPDETNAMVSYQQLDEEWKPLKVVDANGMLSTATYDRLGRVSMVTLPGDFGYSYYNEDTTDYAKTEIPSSDGEVCYFSSRCYTYSDTLQIGWDAYYDDNKHMWFFTEARDAYLSFRYAVLPDVIDSVFLNYYCLRDDAWRVGLYQCPVYPEYNSDLTGIEECLIPNVYPQVGANRLNVTDIVDRYWYPKALVLRADTTFPEDEGPQYSVICSSEHANSSYHPYLEIHGRNISNESDSSWTIIYTYDDTRDDYDGISVTRQVRPNIGEYTPTTRTWFDGLGRPERTEYIDSDDSYDYTTIGYDYAGRVGRTTDQLGYSTRSAFDVLDRTTETTFPSSLSTAPHISLEYGDDTVWPFFRGPGYDCQRTITTDENGVMHYQFADKLGQTRLSSISDGTRWIYTHFNYDDLGNLIEVMRPGRAGESGTKTYFDAILYEYNSLGQLTRECTAVRDTSTDTYDTTVGDYDAIHYVYDKNGNLIGKQDGNLAGLSSWLYTAYDGINRVTHSGRLQIDATGDTVYVDTLMRYFYDQDSCANSKGRLSINLATVRGDNYGEQYDYDARGRLIRQKNVFYPSLVHQEDQYWLVAGPVGGRKHVIEYGYNHADQMTSLEYPDGTVVTYAYDDRGRLASVGTAQDPDRYASFTYTPRDEIETVVLGDNIQSMDYAYNERGWLTSINDGAIANGDMFGEDLYYYSHPTHAEATGQLNGNLLGQKLTLPDGETQTYLYGYDRLDRLMDVYLDEAAAEIESFTYDGNGNRMSYSQYDIGGRTYNYLSGTNKLTGISSSVDSLENSYQYDANGNISGDAARAATFAYDHFNRLEKVYLDGDWGDDEITFAYNNSGDRVVKKYYYHYRDLCVNNDPDSNIDASQQRGYQEAYRSAYEGDDPNTVELAAAGGPPKEYCTYSAAVETHYVRGAGGKVLAEYEIAPDGVYTLVRKYVYAGDQRIAMIDAQGGVYFYLNDHLGSARVVVSEKSGGTVKDVYSRYWAFGADADLTVTTGQPFKYTGKPFDNEGGMGLYYYGARYYAPELGRFTAIDPLASKYPGLSPYVYCANNPMKFVDPDGRTVTITGNEAQQAVDALGKQYNNLTITRDTASGQVSASGNAQTDAEKKFVEAVNSQKINVNLTTVEAGATVPGTNSSVAVGSFNGSTTDKNGVVQTSQYICMSHAQVIENIDGWTQGQTVMHEVLESYLGGVNNPGQAPSAASYDAAHRGAMSIGPGPDGVRAMGTWTTPAGRTVMHLLGPRGKAGGLLIRK
ncbi:MAG: RHS repeat-associated core domain-containing protein [Candidatus Zixiibacteriota bacterium]